MNYLFATVLLLIAPVVLAAQEIHGDFEQWHVSDFEIVREQPVGWKFAGPFGSGRSSDAHSGSASASIWNWYSEIAGIIALGESYPTDGVFHGMFDVGAGVPVSGVPARLRGVYKYDRGDNGGRSDSAVVLILLKRYDPVNHTTDTLSLVTRRLGPASAWTSFDVEIPVPASGLLPDSIGLGFASSDGGMCRSGECDYLRIDDLSLETAAGVPFRMESGRIVPVAVTPNPVRSTAVISFDGRPDVRYAIDVVDESGHPALKLEAAGGRIELRRDQLGAGTYLFTVRDPDGGTVAQGRFVVD
jgi:hypothetical protein